MGGMGLAIFLNRGTAALSTSTFLTVVDRVGYGGFFAGTALQCWVALLFVLVYVPETKGISLEEMTEYFAQITRNPSFFDLMAGSKSVASNEEDESDYEDDDDTGDKY